MVADSDKKPLDLLPHRANPDLKCPVLQRSGPTELAATCHNLLGTGEPELDPVPRHGLTSAEQRGEITANRD